MVSHIHRRKRERARIIINQQLTILPLLRVPIRAVIRHQGQLTLRVNSLGNLELVPIKTLLREQVRRVDKVQRMAPVQEQTMDPVLAVQMADLHQARTPGQVHHLEQKGDQVLVQILLRIPGLHLVRS